VNDLQPLQYRTLLSEELQAVDDLMLEIHSRTPPQISEAIGGIIHSGGKRLRPALVLLSAHICEADIHRAIPLAAAVEMLHTATLIHDDLIDKSSIRRGVETINARWTSPATVLAGDIAFAWAANLATRGKSLDLMVRFSEVLEVICKGELLQMFEEQKVPTIAVADATRRKQVSNSETCARAYYERIYAKTASLFALATEAGPRLANAPQKEIHGLRNFGKLVGEAFQIADDVLDLMGTEESLGKPIGSDLHQGLITLPILRYLEIYPEDDRVLRILNRHPLPKDKFPPQTADIPRSEETSLIQHVISDFRHSGVAEQVMEEATNRVKMALTYLNAYPYTSYRRAMEEIAVFAVRRRY
jgi:geranylgeranyl pyrophosphate synthase